MPIPLLKKREVEESTDLKDLTEAEPTPAESVFSGVLVLTVSNLLVKAMGMFFKIPMNYIMGDTGMGYYNAAYTVYTFFYMLSTAGLPTAVSILVSASNRRPKQCHRILRISLGLFCLIGAAGSGILLCFAEPLSKWIGAPPAEKCITAVAPTLFFICIASAFRGYFQGLARMTPTAVSQLLEALCKVGAGVAGAVCAIRQNAPPHMVAAWAIFGLTIGGAVSMLYLLALWIFRPREGDNPTDQPEPVRGLLRKLTAIALPVTVSSAVMSLSGMIDTVLLQRLLQQNGLTQEAATTLYGNYTSLAVPLFNLPPVLVYPIAYALVPLLTRCLTEGEAGKARGSTYIRSALTLALVLGAPCAAGLSALAEPILTLLYRSESAALAAPLLTLLAPSSLAVCLLAVTNAVLQAIGKAGLPVYSMAVGAGVKILSTVLLVPRLGMTAAPVSTFLCYLTVTAMNLAFVHRYTGAGIPWKRQLTVAVSAILCGLGGRVGYSLLAGFLPQRIAVLPAIAVAALLYLTLIRVWHVLTPADAVFLPKKPKLLRWLGIS